MKFSYFFPCLLVFAGLDARGLSLAAPRVDGVVDWRAQKIYLRAEWMIDQRTFEAGLGGLRSTMRSACLAKLSSIVETLWQRHAEGEVKPELADYWAGLKLSTFQVAENKATATMAITLRGSHSLLAGLPGATHKEEWVMAGGSEGAAYERRQNMGEYDASEGEAIEYTGLIIDARHLDYLPSLAMGVYTSSGRQLYGAEFLSRVTWVKRGTAGFFDNEGVSEARARAGRRPLKVPALETARTRENALVISDEDAARLTAHAGSIRNLKRGRVIVLVKPSLLKEKY